MNARDTVKRNELWKVLDECELEKYLINFVEGLYDGCRERCESWKLDIGEVQGENRGCMTSYPRLLNMFLDK